MYRRLAVWLLVCSAMIWIMVVIGGITRLTESGLSIVEWKPFTGILPPISDAAWQVEFAKYKQYPEYQQINRGMSLDAFKNIFWWEYAHRMWGRLIGLAFLVPLIIAIRKNLPMRDKRNLAGLLLLVGLQGGMGWLMVHSGLQQAPDVSPYRLTAHLLLAMVLLTLTWRMMLSYRRLSTPNPRTMHADRLPTIMLGLCFVTIAIGGLVAGHNAGLIYNTFPFMAGSLVPGELFFYEPWFSNLYANPVTVQWLHRVFAMVTFLTAAATWYRFERQDSSQALRIGARALLASVSVQMMLGITTLVWNVPLVIASLHQANAVLVLLSAVTVGWLARRAT